MNPRQFLSSVVFVLAVLAAGNVSAQDRTAPFTAAEREAVYAASIEKRATNIVAALKVTDAAKATRVHDAIIVQYRALRARDAAIDEMFVALSSDSPGIETNRATILPILSEALHAQFIERLSADLTPEQIEIVMDKMTYNKVQVTYDAYCEIIPNLTTDEKAMILKELKAAREVAVDGGSADEKTAIFQKYKNKINATLNAKGYDVAKATSEWEAKQAKANNTE